MERVNTLINKLQQQLSANESSHQLLQTAQLLVAELSHTQQVEQIGKVSVLMPQIFVAKDELNVEIKLELVETIKPKVETNESIIEPIIDTKIEEKVEPAVEPKIKEIKPVITATTEANKVLHTLLVDDVGDIPTLTSHTKKEINDLAENSIQNINETLKENKQEVVTTLVDAPVKDLRKAIGINDKYLFINELFSGDEAMYERSIKTINNFSVYPEAEQWIKRELYTKLCWLENSATVENFYNSVRRRFV